MTYAINHRIGFSTLTMQSSRFRFSVQTLLWGVLIASVVLGMVAVVRSGMRRHAKTMALCDTYARGHFNLDPKHKHYIISLSIDQYFRRDREAANVLIPRLGGMPKLVVLNVQGFKLTRDELMHIGRLHQLQILDLSSNDITDEDLKFLAELTSLQELDLSHNPIDGYGLVYLEGLTHLKKLNLAWTDASADGLEKLRRLPNLESLALSGTRVNDLAMEAIAKHPALTQLSVKETAVTTEGLMKLAECYSLIRIRVSGEMFGADDDMAAWRKRKDRAIGLFRAARLRSLREALERGENVSSEVDIMDLMITT